MSTDARRINATHVKASCAGSDGFSLVESVVATFILVVGLMAVGSVVLALTGHQRESLDSTTAINLVQEKLEHLQSTHYQLIDGGVEEYGQIQGFSLYRRQVLVTANADDTLKDIDVIVSHTDGDSVAVSTKIAR